MHEELFIIKEGKRCQLDLSSPTGITLNFKSVIFDDLSKITSSFSYTFKLPITVNNRRILESAEDIRCTSSMIRKRLKCEFVQNGIPLFSNANLYVESVESCFNAIMTWNVVKGFAELKDDDISINELVNENKEVLFGAATDKSMTEVFDNSSDVLVPCYACGLPYRKWHVDQYQRYRYTWYEGFNAPPMPVVPIYKLIELINAHYGTTFKLGKHIPSDGLSNVEERFRLIELGVVPLVNLDLNEEQIAERRVILGNMRFTADGTSVECNDGSVKFNDVITFGTLAVNKTDYMEPADYTMGIPMRGRGTQYRGVGVQPMISGLGVEFSGSVSVVLDITQSPGNDDVPTLRVFQYQRYYDKDARDASRRALYKWKEMASCEGELLGVDISAGNRLGYLFNFDGEKGGEPLTCSNCAPSLYGGPLLFVFSHKIYQITNASSITCDIVDVSKCLGTHSIDIMSNLPDISCLAFMKALYFMLGAFPQVDVNGNIVPHFFNDIENNLNTGNTLDWSKKLLGEDGKEATKTTYVCGSYGQRNRYLMKSDPSEEGDEEDKDNKDIYAKGVGEIIVGNETLDRVKNIIQVPFYAPYIKNKKHPKYATGDTMKVWELGDAVKHDWERDAVYNRTEFKEPKPCVGIVYDRPYYLSHDGSTPEEQGRIMSMKVWEGFKDMSANPSFRYLQRIIYKPYVITEYFDLNEFDLRDLDYSVPVYLNKHNSYFAIVSVTRDSKGKCKCELIKLP